MSNQNNRVSIETKVDPETKRIMMDFADRMDVSVSEILDHMIQSYIARQAVDRGAALEYIPSPFQQPTELRKDLKEQLSKYAQDIGIEENQALNMILQVYFRKLSKKELWSRYQTFAEEFGEYRDGEYIPPESVQKRNRKG